jgi:glycosyltransferase involved in cell wall biosynthesis
MEFGINDDSPLLTIAIPTWNRDENLKIALDRLLVQLKGLELFLEIIVSDNCSTDNTKQVVKDSISNYPLLRIVYNRNEFNLGFFGNFCVCRKLSQGKYLWILSDDDYVSEGTVKEIINLLKMNSRISVLYLDDGLKKAKKKIQFLDKNNFFLKYRHKSGLISRVIFWNSKIYDEEIVLNYINNGFIGWIFMLNSFRSNDLVCLIRANSLETAKAFPKGYDYFELFVSGSKDVIDFMRIVGIHQRVIKKFRRTFFIELVYHSYLIVRIYGFKSLHGGKLISRSVLSIDEEIKKIFYDDNLIKSIMNVTIRLSPVKLKIVYFCFFVYLKIKDKLC